MSRRPRKPKALIAAYDKGARSRFSGEPRSTNPYFDLRTGRGAVTWSRAFGKAWNNGWDDEDARWVAHTQEEKP